MIKRFNRFELKYLLDMVTAERLMADIAAMTVPDPYGGLQGYLIRSLYYDSPDFDCFWDKIEGLKYRRKVRIRVYPTGKEELTHGLVEIKQRINRTVQKRRLQLPLEQAYRLCSSELQPSLLDPADQAVAAEVAYLAQVKQLQPACIIEYQRRPFIGTPYNPGLRITFDSQLKARTHDLQVAVAGHSSFFVPPHHCIMEVKVNDKVPDWVTFLLNSYSCRVIRVSKYCSGLVQVGAIATHHSLEMAEYKESKRWAGNNLYGLKRA